MNKKILFFFIFLFSFCFIFASCGQTPPDNPDEDTYRVMVALGEGFIVSSQNPLDVKKGENAIFDIEIADGYLFTSASVGTYDEKTGKLTVENVDKRTTVTFTVESLGYDTSIKYKYLFKGLSTDYSSKPTSELNAGTLITVEATNEQRAFAGWSFGKSAVDGGKIVSKERKYQFRLSPDLADGDTVRIFSNYTDANVYYYDLNGGKADSTSQNLVSNDYYTVKIEGNRVQVILLNTYYDFAECASLFWDDGCFYREGYVLKEYNTAPDGSGEGYSIGSKYHIGSDGFPLLYCIWEKETGKSHFEYENLTIARPVAEKYAPDWNEEGIIITSYVGDSDKVTVPEYIDGVPVIAIGEGAFTSRRVKTLILPKTIVNIEDGAFVNCSSLTELYLPDSVYYISDAIFDAATYSDFKRLIVNATLAPRYSTSASGGGFAVKLSRLMAAEAGKRVIIISGSSTYQGLASEYMEALFGGEYSVINFGTTRTRPGNFYLEAMSHFTTEGDVIIYAPENSAHMMGEGYIGARMLYENEGMNNFYRYVDISNYHGYFSSFHELNAEYRYKRMPNRYEDIVKTGASINKYGDYQHKNRQGYLGKTKYIDSYFITLNKWYKSIDSGSWDDEVFQAATKDYNDPANATYWTDITNSELSARINKAIASAKSSGAGVYFGFAPADAYAIVPEARNKDWLLNYDKLISDTYDFDGLIGSSADYVFAHEYFYDCAYHVNDYGRAYRSYKLYTDVAELLGITDVKGYLSVGTDFQGCLFEKDYNGALKYTVDFLK